MNRLRGDAERAVIRGWTLCPSYSCLPPQGFNYSAQLGFLRPVSRPSSHTPLINKLCTSSPRCSFCAHSVWPASLRLAHVSHSLCFFKMSRCGQAHYSVLTRNAKLFNVQPSRQVNLTPNPSSSRELTVVALYLCVSSCVILCNFANSKQLMSNYQYSTIFASYCIRVCIKSTSRVLSQLITI